MNLTRSLLALALLAISAAPALADTQDHHCKQTDGTFDGKKTKAQCTAAKGTWAKDVEYTGLLKTGVNAIGGETTGITLDAADKQSYELDLHGDPALQKVASERNGKAAKITGYATVKAGVEIKQRHIIVVTTVGPA